MLTNVQYLSIILSHFKMYFILLVYSRNRYSGRERWTELWHWLRRYLVEEQNEVDGKTHKQSQETQVVEVTSQIVLERKKKVELTGRQTTHLSLEKYWNGMEYIMSRLTSILFR